MKKLTRITGLLVLMSTLAFVGCAMFGEPETLKMKVTGVPNTESKKLTDFYNERTMTVFGSCVLDNENCVLTYDNQVEKNLKVSVADIPEAYKLIIKENGFSDNVNLDNMKMYILNPDTPATDVNIEITLTTGFPTKITGARYVLFPSLMGADKGYDLYQDGLVLYGHIAQSENNNTDFNNETGNVEIPERLNNYKAVFEKFKNVGTVVGIYDTKNKDKAVSLLFEYSNLDINFYKKLEKDFNVFDGNWMWEHEITNPNQNYKYIEVNIIKVPNNPNKTVYGIGYAENVEKVADFKSKFRFRSSEYSEDDFNALFE